MVGNFWAASCDYLKDLQVGEYWPKPAKNDDWSKYVQAEMWIGNFTGRGPGEDLKFLALFNIRANLYFYQAVPEAYSWVLTEQTFFQGNQTGKYYDDWFRLAQYDTGNQTAIWLDYLSGLGRVKYNNEVSGFEKKEVGR